MAGHLLELCFDCCDEDVGFSCLMEKLVAGAASSELLVKYMIQDVGILIVMTLPRYCHHTGHSSAGWGCPLQKVLYATFMYKLPTGAVLKLILLALKSASHCPAMPTSFLVWKPF